MADQFDSFLSTALAAPERDADRPFVARVQARIAVEDRLAAERRSVVRRLALELMGLAAVAAGLFLLGRAAPVAALVAESEALALVVLLSIFALLVAVLSVQPGHRGRYAMLSRGSSRT